MIRNSRGAARGRMMSEIKNRTGRTTNGSGRKTDRRTRKGRKGSHPAEARVRVRDRVVRFMMTPSC
jgi:hypothetical protein